MADGSSRQPAASRPGGRTARVRERILDATVQLVGRHGLAGLRYDELAELAGVHKSSVYRNWPERETLVSEALLRYAAETAVLTDTGDLRRDLIEFLIDLAATLDTPTGRAVQSAALTGHENPNVARAVAAVFEQRLEVMRTRVEVAVERGELPPVDAYFFGELLCSPVHLYVSRGVRPFTRAVAEQVTDVVLAGIRETSRRE
ncbi:TetR/AcrR family transcriptional regulator [Amycolatopsis jiangsuensis]|uniref:AcrR family transcriptional regulator n=1 Tax=Amycolatopsis jiangsuensis TaxID=1181879 RepID=A0A840IVM4_9PSEU|nr:TetR/AcrR family transcriptional regulator [Amycolatopsis jiangsuensis]MBB4686791.1 AcrR family transcriptional regulator [Amycolatopsis jiangsuensis]